MRLLTVVTAATVLLAGCSAAIPGTPTAGRSVPRKPAAPAVAPCGPGNRDFCVPHVDLDRDVLPALERKGFDCGGTPQDGDTAACRKRGGAPSFESVQIEFAAPEYQPGTSIAYVDISGNTSRTGPGPDLTQRSWELAVTGLTTVTPVLFPGRPDVSGALDNWASNMNVYFCADTFGDAPPKIDRYELQCQQATPITLSTDKGDRTSWTSSIDLSAPIS